MVTRMNKVFAYMQCTKWLIYADVDPLKIPSGIWCCSKCHWGDHNKCEFRNSFAVCCGIGEVCLKDMARA